jgi:hypothetical protein
MRSAPIALALLLAGCGVEVFETQLLVLAESEACTSAIARGTTVNAYRAALFEMTVPPREGDTRAPCFACFEDETCVLREMSCRCSVPTPPATVPLNRMLDGVRFADLDPEARYCMALVAHDVPALDAPAEGSEDCACDFGGIDVTGTSRVCGATPFPARVGENESFVPLAADCPPLGCPMFELRL